MYFLKFVKKSSLMKMHLFCFKNIVSTKKGLKSNKKKNQLTDDSPKNISFMINQITKPPKIKNT